MTSSVLVEISADKSGREMSLRVGTMIAVAILNNNNNNNNADCSTNRDLRHVTITATRHGIRSRVTDIDSSITRNIIDQSNRSIEDDLDEHW